MRIIQVVLIMGIAASATPSFAQRCLDKLHRDYNTSENHYGIKKEQSIEEDSLQMDEMKGVLPNRRVFSMSFAVDRTVDRRNDGGNVLSLYCISAEDGKSVEGIESDLPH